jgi:hypothetical protein
MNVYCLFSSLFLFLSSIVFADEIQPDSSIEIKFSVPLHHIENAKLAKRHRISKFYEYRKPDGSPSFSSFSVTFHKVGMLPSLSLKKFIQVDLERLKKRLPEVEIKEVKLPKEVTKNFTEGGFSFLSYVVYAHKREEPDNFYFFFATQQGVWEILWTARFGFIREDSPLFFNFIEHIKISQRELEL